MFGCTVCSSSCGVLPLSIAAASAFGIVLFSHGGEWISPHVTKMTQYFEAAVSPCPGRMGATPLRMAEQAGTWGRQQSAPAVFRAVRVAGDGGIDDPSHNNAHVPYLTSTDARTCTRKHAKSHTHAFECTRTHTHTHTQGERPRR